MTENALARLADGSSRGFNSARCASGDNPGGRSTSLLLDVQYGAYSLYNPATNAYDKVNLRSYNGCPMGPTVSINPGATLRVSLRNDLPAETASTCPAVMDPTTPACFNTVNLHLHGLHVSPSGHADNVLLHIAPGGSFQYRYDIPANHPAGTFWYHSHSHGSTAIDVTSGMEGVLIVRGTRTAAARGQNGGVADIDTILHRPVTKAAFPEHVFLFQQIEYGCFQDATATAPIADPTTYAWRCPGGKVGELRNYTAQLNFIADPRPAYAGEFNSTWSISGRYTQINGVVQPVFPSSNGVVPAGEIRRLRLVHGGNRDSINFKIVKADLSAFGMNMTGTVGTPQLDAATRAVTALLSGKSPAGQTTTLDRICSGEVVEQEEIAVDGLTRSAIVEKAVNPLNPGYRSDVLVAFPSPGLYCILDEAADAATTVNFRAGASRIKDRRLLSFARVGPGVNIPEYATDGAGHTKYWQYLRNQLTTANADLPGDVLANLRNLNTTAFAPQTEIAGVVSQKVPTVFSIDRSTGVSRFVINGESYDPNRIDYTATLGTVDEWRVSASAAGGHIFHIHINPFEVVDILNGAGTSIYDTTGACTAAEIATGDTQYCSLYHVFRDTMFIKAGYTAVLHTKYEDYTGEFVMHCHILDHEDQGMMQNIRIVSSKTAMWRKLVDPILAASRRTEDTVRLWAGLPARRSPLLANGLLDAPLCRAPSSGPTSFSGSRSRL
ncbi:multicopper oxidase domain-containing protein [Robbsia sp. Bb-Pol-6]|uniref:Multicopper oxidase domain-containing protein n=1 Tax=Robbsia betulipollinis TaxID=2981849 RepID=A0ABT3ZKS2_9BURK|nr:multicopper oxidase domain-containing protein [Robbsia betulipollinis]MCY0386540.1 multicopper oxidase domain-containing protein [Robbsia betulipollinis]